MRSVLDRARARCGRSGDEAGFTLVEVLVAMVVLAVMALAAVSGLITSTTSSTTSRQRIAAADLAAAELERFDAIPAVTDIPIGVQPARTVTVGSTAYSVQATSQWESDPTPPADRCSGPGTGAFAYVRVTAVVSWPSLDSTRSISSQTLFTPKAGTGPVNTAAQRVRVFDGAGQPVSGLSVSLTGLTAGLSGPFTTSTDPQGCVVFPNLVAGMYEISANTLPYVGVNGVQLHEQTVTIDSTQTPSLVEFRYDRAARLEVSFAAPAGYPPATGVTAWVLNSAMQPLGSKTQPGSAGSTVTSVSSLFPFVDGGYQVWLGGCKDADLATYGQARPLAAVTPGGTTSKAVPGGQMGAQVRLRQDHASGKEDKATYTWVSGATVQAVNEGTPACAETHTFPVVTDSYGWSGVTLPFGTWRIKVVGRTTYGGAAWPLVTVTPQTTPLAVPTITLS